MVIIFPSECNAHSYVAGDEGREGRDGVLRVCACACVCVCERDGKWIRRA